MLYSLHWRKRKSCGFKCSTINFLQKLQLHMIKKKIDERIGPVHTITHILQKRWREVIRWRYKTEMLEDRVLHSRIRLNIPVQVWDPVEPRRTPPRHSLSHHPRLSSSGSRTSVWWPSSPSLRAWLSLHAPHDDTYSVHRSSCRWQTNPPPHLSVQCHMCAYMCKLRTDIMV